SDVQLVHCKRLIHTSLQRVLRPRDPHPLPTRRSSDLRRPKAVVNMASITAACAKNPRLTEPSCTSVLLPSRSAGLSKQIEQLQRSEEHTSELQSRENLVCRLLLEKTKGPVSLDYTYVW